MKKRLFAVLVIVALVVTAAAFAVAAEPVNPFDGQTGTVNAYCDECKANVDWAPLPADTAAVAANGGHYYLAADYTLAAPIAVAEGKAICLHLNNKALNCTTSAFTMMKANAVVSIFDAAEGTGAIVGTVSKSTNGGIALMTEGTFNLYSGTLKLANPDQVVLNGGILYAEKNAAVNIYGGKVIGGTAAKGGAIYSMGPVTMTAGTVTGGSGTDRAGNFFIGSTGSLTLSGGLIENGIAAGNQMGGNIYAEGCITMSGGTVTGGKTYLDVVSTPDAITGAGRGGNICARKPGRFVMTGGTVSNGIAPFGGNMCLEGDNAEGHVISGGVITGGTANRGGNIWSQQTAPVTITGDALIENGVANQLGGGNLYSEMSKITISGGTITGGQAGANGYTARGGNILVRGTAVLTMTGGTVKDGKSPWYLGGNISFEGTGAHLITGGTISGGTAVKGGNIAVTDSNAARATVPVIGDETSGPVITGGVSTTKHGNNIYMNVGQLTLNKCQITGAEAEGSDIELEKGKKLYINAGADLQGNLIHIRGAYALDEVVTDVVVADGSTAALDMYVVNKSGSALPTYKDGDETKIALELNLSKVFVHPGAETVGMYFNAEVKKNDSVKIKNYGIATSLAGAIDADFMNNSAVAYTKEAFDSAKLTIYSAMVKNVMQKAARNDAEGNPITNDAAGKLDIYAAAYVELEDGTIIVGAPVALSLFDVMTAVNAQYAETAAPQNIIDFVANWSGETEMGTWGLDKLVAAAPAA